MNVAQSIAHWLADKEITHAFGIVGGGNVAIWDAITRLEKTRLVSVHHEQAAAMAASYYYRTSGRLALCLVTTGAGSANAITGVLAAWMDHVPLIVISGNEPSRYFGDPLAWSTRVKGTQGYDSAAVARSFCKYAVQVNAATANKVTLDFVRNEALRTTNGGPGPVWVDIPKDIQTCAASTS